MWKVYMYMLLFQETVRPEFEAAVSNKRTHPVTKVSLFYRFLSCIEGLFLKKVYWFGRGLGRGKMQCSLFYLKKKFYGWLFLGEKKDAVQFNCFFLFFGREQKEDADQFNYLYFYIWWLVSKVILKMIHDLCSVPVVIFFIDKKWSF